MSRVNDAFDVVPRANFLPADVADMAAIDSPLYIGYGVTNSQPSTVKHMLEWLDVRPGQRVLDVGSGSGWSSALLAHLTSEKGSVVAVERVPKLVRTGRDNTRRLRFNNVTFHQAGKIFGWPKDGPYERILVSATSARVPQALIDQLALGGRMVIPVKNSILVVDKDKFGKIHKKVHPGFAFVPLISSS